VAVVGIQLVDDLENALVSERVVKIGSLVLRRYLL
jgi:hypothetical protein